MAFWEEQLDYLEAKAIALAAAIEDLECVVSTAKEQAALTLLIETRGAMLEVIEQRSAHEGAPSCRIRNVF
jgi:hypothetical protein